MVTTGDGTFSAPDITNPNSTFWGVKSATPITQLRLDTVAPGPLGDGFVTIDNTRTVGADAAPMPAPGSLTLLGLGLTAAGFARRPRIGQDSAR